VGSVPTIDLGPWFGGTPDGRRAVAAEVDDALKSVGFFLLTGHGVTRDQRAGIRKAARAFFARRWSYRATSSPGIPGMPRTP